MNSLTSCIRFLLYGWFTGSKKAILRENGHGGLISIGMLILVIWNIWAFCGHIVEYLLPLGHLGPIPGTQIPGILVTSWLDVAYYILKFNNLISVPAMWFIYMGLADLKRDLK
ncbi:MAG: hypothetical protein ACUVQ2_04080 [Dissulfurimicrobium sp.]|uniref:hypothetical protein n=1 Tax=Dissulfurimicrobium sp. TaxID=2022436 RepID=UPI00404955EA